MRDLFDLKEHWKKILLFSIVPVIYTYLFLLYSLKLKLKFLFENIPEETKNAFLIFNFILMMIVLMICIAIGFSWSKRHGLIGWKEISVKDELFWSVLAWSLGLSLFSYVYFDRIIFENIRVFWPEDILDCIIKQLRYPLLLEIILRFGLVTLVFRLNRNITRSVLYIALFFSIGAIFNQIRYFDIEVKSTSWFFLSFIYLFMINSVSGYFYYKGGILYSILFQFLLGIRYYLYLLEV